MTGTTRMSPTGSAPVEFTDNQLDVFRVLYPLFKNEVFQRREHMMRLTAFAGTVLISIQIALFILPPGPTTTSPTSWFSISGVTVFSSLFAYLILQQADRHRMAKQQVIELEQSLGFYHQEWQLTGETLFPKNWQTDWTADRSVALYLAILATLTTLVICSMLVRNGMAM